MSKAIAAAEKLDLVAATSGRSSIAENGFSAKRLGTEFAALIAQSGLEPGSIEVAHLTQGFLPDQRCVQFVCRNDAGTSCAIIILPINLFEHLFVQIYGGDRVENASAVVGSAQRRFAQRLGTRLCAWLATAWPGTAAPRLILADACFDPSQQAEALNRFASAMQLGIEIALPGAPSQQVQLAIAPELLATSAPQQTKRAATNRPADWLARMTERAGRVPLPVRSEIAGISMPAARLLTLQPGDVLPIAMPQAIPVFVGDRNFASASMGEWQGSAALRIETLNESCSV